MNARTCALLLATVLLPAFTSATEPASPPASEVRESACTLVLGPELDGRFFVYNEKGALVSEVLKPAGRTMELTLEPGTYDVVYQREPARLDTTVELAQRERKVLERESFHAVEQAPPPTPKAEASTGLHMKGRTRIELFGGFSDSYEIDTDWHHTEVGGGQGGLAIVHWLREDVALDFQFLGTDVDVESFDEGPWESTETDGSFSMLFGARYYFPKATYGGTFRPFVAAGIGPFSQFRATSNDHHTHVHHYDTKFGGQVAGGVDFQLSRLFSLGVKVDATFRDGYDTSFGSTFGFGFAWGKGKN